MKPILSTSGACTQTQYRSFAFDEFQLKHIRCSFLQVLHQWVIHALVHSARDNILNQEISILLMKSPNGTLSVPCFAG
jgi:hypothetical protein